MDAQRGARNDDAAPARSVALRLRAAPDADVRRPLWDYAPEDRPAVIHERRRRFGVYDDDE